MIVIPAIDVREGKVVRLRHGRLQEVIVYADDPVETARGYAADGAQWVHVVDLDAAFDVGDNRPVIADVTREADVPIQVGGGLRSLYLIEGVLAVGAARVVLGTEAILDPGFLAECVERYGERVVVALDTDGDVVKVRGWTEPAGSFDQVLQRLVRARVPRLLVTAIARDGTLEGPDLDLYRRLSHLEVPVLASGGVSSLEDLRGLARAGVEGAVVGKALYEGHFTLREAMEVPV
ncbi:MAG TPA: 1-(5-phosphoribosyl)-5-[(5-phosphoribosylamino)methylideneamino]imidazole-4-carboxamide isomerase [Actinomycetota bacterium]